MAKLLVYRLLTLEFDGVIIKMTARVAAAFNTTGVYVSVTENNKVIFTQVYDIYTFVLKQASLIQYAKTQYCILHYSDAILMLEDETQAGGWSVEPAPQHEIPAPEKSEPGEVEK